MNMRTFRCILLILLSVPHPGHSGEQARLLRFIHREGEVLHADALVNETILLNGRLSHRARIEELSVSTVDGVDDRGTARLDSRFRTLEEARTAGGSLQWISEEQVSLERESSGLMIVPEDAVFPVVRSVPRFPDRPVAPGDSWSLPAREVHVFRMRDGLHGPYGGDLQVHYRYLERLPTDRDGTARIALEYNVYLPVRSPSEPVYLITGRSQQEILWDIERGRPVRKKEEFEFLMMDSEGNTREFLGDTVTHYRYTMKLDREEESRALNEDLSALPGLSVEAVDQGILFTLSEDVGAVFFQPESALITDDQKILLEGLARSLEHYVDRDLLITGHTADYGSAAGRERLSLERAAAVAGELFPRGRPGPGRLFLRGAGSSAPTGSDRENRRVEILILD